MKAKAGMGIDMVTPVDYQRLPVEGQAELLLILEAVEATLAWPAQTLAVIGKLTPKKTAGDRAIGL
eukprot:1042989-Pyramimonas_sp.AAC.1